MKPTFCLLLVSFILMGYSCVSLFDCGNELTSEIKSPDGKFKAVVFRRSCGATTGYSTQVSIIAANQKLPAEAGNVASALHEVKLTIRWLSSNQLQVIHPKAIELNVSRKSVEG